MFSFHIAAIHDFKLSLYIRNSTNTQLVKRILSSGNTISKQKLHKCCNFQLHLDAGGAQHSQNILLKPPISSTLKDFFM